MRSRALWIILLLTLGLVLGLIVSGCGGGGGGGGGDDDDTDDDDTTDDDTDVDLTPCDPDFETGIEPNTVGTIDSATELTVWAINALTCEPIEGAYVNYNGTGDTTGADGKVTFPLKKALGSTVHVLHQDYNFRSYVNVDANTFLVRLTPLSDVANFNKLSGTFYCPDGDINTLLPQAESVLKAALSGQRLVAGLAIKGLMRDVLATLNFDAIFTGTTTITIPAIPGILPDGATIDDVPENIWIPELPFGIGSGSIQLDPYYISFDPNIAYQPITGMALSADVTKIVTEILPYITQDPFPIWDVDWGEVIKWVNIERVGLERNYKPSDMSDSNIGLSVPITTGFGSGVPVYPFTVSVSGLPSKAVTYDVIDIAAGEMPYRGIELFWFGMGTNSILMGAAPKSGVLKDMKYLVLSAATDLLAVENPVGYLSVVIKELDQLTAGDNVSVNGFLDFLSWNTNDPDTPTQVNWDAVSGSDLAMIVFTLEQGDTTYSWTITAPPDAGTFSIPAFDPGFTMPTSTSAVLMVTANEGFDYNEFNELNLMSTMKAITTTVGSLF